MNDFKHDLGDGLALLPPLPRHAVGQFAAVERSRERIGRWLNWVADVEEELDEWSFLRSACRTQGRRQGATGLIHHRGEFSGAIDCKVTSRRGRVAEIGYWLADGHEGAGVMTRCAAAMLGHGHGALRLPRMFLCASVENWRSRAVMKRIGCAHEATLVAGDPLPDGRVTDQVVYGHIDASLGGEPIECVLATDVPGVELVLQQPHHARGLFDLIERNRGHLSPWLGFVHRVKSPRDVRRLIRQSWEMLAEETGEIALIRRDGELVGGVGVSGMNGVLRRGSLGYWLAAGHEGQGVMTAALGAFVRHVWAVYPDLVRLELQTLPGNARSRRVAERCGFLAEGRLQLSLRIGGTTHDTIIHGMRRPSTT
jgi:ribosomal-protein-serine acetyltransferase